MTRRPPRSTLFPYTTLSRSATASDLVDGGTDTVACTPASGSTFALGNTTVTCTAKDAANNTGTCSFTVTVHDTTAPTVSCPSDMVKEATSAAGAVATFTATASDLVDGGTDTVTCTPASGSTFALGNTTMTCTAKDAANNTGTCSFTEIGRASSRQRVKISAAAVSL